MNGKTSVIANAMERPPKPSNESSSPSSSHFDETTLERQRRWSSPDMPPKLVQRLMKKQKKNKKRPSLLDSFVLPSDVVNDGEGDVMSSSVIKSMTSSSASSSRQNVLDDEDLECKSVSGPLDELMQTERKHVEKQTKLRSEFEKRLRANLHVKNAPKLLTESFIDELFNGASKVREIHTNLLSKLEGEMIRTIPFHSYLILTCSVCVSYTALFERGYGALLCGIAELLWSFSKEIDVFCEYAASLQASAYNLKKLRKSNNDIEAFFVRTFHWNPIIAVYSLFVHSVSASSVLEKHSTHFVWDPFKEVRYMPPPSHMAISCPEVCVCVCQFHGISCC